MSESRVYPLERIRNKSADRHSINSWRSSDILLSLELIKKVEIDGR